MNDIACVADVARVWARKTPDAEALWFEGRSTTYAELDRAASRCANALIAAGVQPGDRVAVILPNCPQHVVALFAVLRVGAVVTHCNPLAPAHELRQQLRDAGAEVVVCLDRTVPTVLEVRADCRVRS
ncbi:MAG TPA: AMP-binding protein, partial [Caulobacteraceae bacterium]|nr:AMP-binding protein [Caulobacteraceae bacterium]